MWEVYNLRHQFILHEEQTRFIEHFQQLLRNLTSTFMVRDYKTVKRYLSTTLLKNYTTLRFHYFESGVNLRNVTHEIW